MTVHLLQPRAGEVLAHEWRELGGARHVLVVAALRPYPYYRTTTRAKWKDPRAKRYYQWRDGAWKAIDAALRTARIEPLTGLLGVSVNAGATKSSRVDAKRNKDGSVDKRTITSILDWDADNVIKAVSDACNGILFKDDKAIRCFGPMTFYDTSADWFSIHAWGPNERGQLSLWDSDWYSEPRNGPTEASDWLAEQQAKGD